MDKIRFTAGQGGPQSIRMCEQAHSNVCSVFIRLNAAIVEASQPHKIASPRDNR